MTSSKTKQAEAALEYAKLGFAVLPLEPRGKNPLGILVPHGVKNATTDRGVIKSWWSKAPNANVGIACGAASNGLVVIDIDNHKEHENGEESLAAWSRETGESLPETLTAFSGSGGRHLYYRSDKKIRNKVGLIPGVDIRGEGGYIVAPPSIHETGGEYRWMNGHDPAKTTIASVNETVVRFIQGEPTQITTADISRPLITEGGRNNALYMRLMTLRKAGCGMAVIREEASRFNAEALCPPLGGDEVRRVVESVSNNVTASTAISGFLEEKIRDSLIKLYSMRPECTERYKNTEIGWANLFADAFKDEARFCPDLNAWLYYDGVRWVKDLGSLYVAELAKALADALHIYVLTLSETDRKIFHPGWEKWQILKTRLSIIKDARGVHPVRVDEFDSDPYLLNVGNGTLNLKTSELQPHSPDDLITRLAPVAFNPDAQFDRWDEFIHEIMEGDVELEDYLRQCIGYALTGSTRLEKLFILYGPKSRNGKSTLLEAILGTLGDYGASSDPEMLSVGRNTAGGLKATEDLARLRGVRMVCLAEPPQGMKMNSAKVKQWTGGDTVKARFLNENSFEYKPQFKFYVNTNELPTITDSALFSSARIVVIPFNRHFSEEEQDPTLKLKFAQPEARSAILNWLIHGNQSLEKTGLYTPNSAKQAIDEYMHSSNDIRRFIDDRLERRPGGKIKTTELFQEYNSWATMNGVAPMNQNTFKGEITRAGLSVRRARTDGGKNPVSVVEDYSIKRQG